MIRHIKTIKNSENSIELLEKDVKFSLKEPVEETKDLIAVHNMTSDELIKSFELGGLPMPSIALLRRNAGITSTAI